MTVYVYHGKGRGVKPQQLARYNCVLTTYTSMSMEAAPKASSKQGTNPTLAIELDDDMEDDFTASGQHVDASPYLAWNVLHLFCIDTPHSLSRRGG